MYLPKIEDLNDPFECNIFYDLDIMLDNLRKLINSSCYFQTINFGKRLFLQNILHRQ